MGAEDVCALRRREQFSGQGRWVQTSLIEAGITLLDFQATRWTMDKKVPPQEGNYHPTNVPMGLFPPLQKISGALPAR